MVARLEADLRFAGTNVICISVSALFRFIFFLLLFDKLPIVLPIYSCNILNGSIFVLDSRFKFFTLIIIQLEEIDSLVHWLLLRRLLHHVFAEFFTNDITGSVQTLTTLVGSLDWITSEGLHESDFVAIMVLMLLLSRVYLLLNLSSLFTDLIPFEVSGLSSLLHTLIKGIFSVTICQILCQLCITFLVIYRLNSISLDLTGINLTIGLGLHPCLTSCLLELFFRFGVEEFGGLPGSTFIWCT